MYCRNCGAAMNDMDRVCPKCNTKKGEGINFCQMCGYHTSIKTKFCLNCGAKQKIIVTQQMKAEHLELLHKQAKTTKLFMKVDKVFAIVGLLLAIMLFVFLISRPEPDFGNSISIPYWSKVVYGYDVQIYWAQGRKIVAYMCLSLLLSVSSVVSFFVQKSKYKKIMKLIKEEK